MHLFYNQIRYKKVKSNLHLKAEGVRNRKNCVTMEAQDLNLIF